MANNAKPKKNELDADYEMLEDMSRQLQEHQKNVNAISRKIARTLKTDLKYGLLENLDIVTTHMRNAKRELDRAKKELKRI
ncbi:Uncharacterised protein [uncultured archaeon]|nr:Uncharacterised protein [uncultured archaeon]